MLGTVLGLTALCAIAAAQAPEGPTVPRVTLDLNGVPLATALDALFKQAGLQYAVEPNTPSFPLTLHLTDVDFPTALRTVLRLAGATYRKESALYIIGPRVPDLVAAAPMPNYYLEQRPAPGPAVEQIWEKIPLQYLNATLLATALNGGILPAETTVLGGSGAFISSGTTTGYGYNSGSMGLGPLGSGGLGGFSGMGVLGAGSFGTGFGSFGAFDNSFNGLGGGFARFGGPPPSSYGGGRF